jgi:MarR family transcriptional regulator for hemolysin
MTVHKPGVSSAAISPQNETSMTNAEPDVLDPFWHQTLPDAGMEVWSIDTRSTLELLVALRIPFVARSWTARAKRLFNDEGYTAAQRAPLYVLARAPKGLTQSELAATIQVSEAALSRRIAQATADGLVSRHRLIGDGRANLIRIEEKGLEVLAFSDRIARQDREVLLRDISDEDLAVTARVLAVLSDRINASQGRGRTKKAPKINLA